MFVCNFELMKVLARWHNQQILPEVPKPCVFYHSSRPILHFLPTLEWATGPRQNFEILIFLELVKNFVVFAWIVI